MQEYIWQAMFLHAMYIQHGNANGYLYYLANYKNDLILSYITDYEAQPTELSGLEISLIYWNILPKCYKNNTINQHQSTPR